MAPPVAAQLVIRPVDSVRSTGFVIGSTDFVSSQSIALNARRFVSGYGFSYIEPALESPRPQPPVFPVVKLMDRP
jgi:hypothetical protein